MTSPCLIIVQRSGSSLVAFEDPILRGPVTQPVIFFTSSAGLKHADLWQSVSNSSTVRRSDQEQTTMCRRSSARFPMHQQCMAVALELGHRRLPYRTPIESRSTCCHQSDALAKLPPAGRRAGSISCEPEAKGEHQLWGDGESRVVLALA